MTPVFYIDPPFLHASTPWDSDSIVQQFFTVAPLGKNLVRGSLRFQGKFRQVPVGAWKMMQVNHLEMGRRSTNHVMLFLNVFNLWHPSVSEKSSLQVCTLAQDVTNQRYQFRQSFYASGIDPCRLTLWSLSIEVCLDKELVVTLGTPEVP